MSTDTIAVHGHGGHGPARGVMRWITTTNHKDIGTLYLVFALIMFFVGGSMAMVIRSELAQPGLQIVDPDFFNQMMTLHGLIMIFGVLMPALVGFANWMVPMQVGAPDMALPRLNNWSFWLLVAGMAMLVSTLAMPGGAPEMGWTMYAPNVLQTPYSFAFMVFSIHLMGISSILGSMNIISTVLNLRAPGMKLLKMPIFCWGWFVTALLLIVIMPVLAGGVTMLLFDRFFGTSFFDAAGGGSPILWQHVFWFFGHPEVYVMILPAFGIISEVIPTFSRKPLFGYTTMVYALASIAFISFVVWAHHMFTSGMPTEADIFFMYATMLIAVPTGVKIFNWVATMWRGSLSFETPMLFATGFLFTFTIGGFTGVMMALVPNDFQYHNSYFIVAHFHYVLVGGTLMALFAGAYYWIPKWTGHMYNERLGKTHFWLSMISVNVLFFPQHFLGLAGMPRRVPDYALQFTDLNLVSSIGGFVFGASQLLFLYNVVRTMYRGKQATTRVWDGAHGLEWTIPSPAPYHTFQEAPDVK